MFKIIFLSVLVFFSGTFLLSDEIKSNDWRNRKFTAEELKKYNGLNGMPAYVAVNGVVYDVSKSKYWKKGIHQKLHQAGNDLTYEIKNQAPKFHKNGKILESFPKVGIYEIENSTNTTTKNNRQTKVKSIQEKKLKTSSKETK